MRRFMPLVGVLVFVGLLAFAVPSARSVVIAGNGFSADVSATVTPTRLPTQGSAPVTLAVAGAIAPAADGSVQLKAVEMRLDRQIQITTTGLPTCAPSDLRGHAPAQARRKCKAALVGSGAVTTQVQYPPGTAPFDLHSPLLFFNGAASRLLMYAFVPRPLGPAAFVASGSARGRVLEVPFPTIGTTSAFRFRLGKTWIHQGQKRSYLSGRCAGGALSNRVTLTFRDGPRLSGAVPARCGRGS